RCPQCAERCAPGAWFGLRPCFFTSRRRHTTCYRDWSSDVCSSDLSKLPNRSMYQALDRTIATASRKPAPQPRVNPRATDFRVSEIGRASCRERVEIAAAAENLKAKRTGRAGAQGDSQQVQHIDQGI